jgi:hypothetical protein
MLGILVPIYATRVQHRVEDTRQKKEVLTFCVANLQA